MAEDNGFNEKLDMALAALRKLAREERENKTVGQASLTIDLQQGGITDSRVGFVRKIK